MIQTHRSCVRFYGDETVMHDHNRVNYNERFSFENIECNQHLERDLQKVADDNPKHTWAKR